MLNYVFWKLEKASPSSLPKCGHRFWQFILARVGNMQLSFETFPSFAVLFESQLYSFKHICVMKLCGETVMKILMFILFCWPSQIKEHLAKGQRMLAGDGMSQVTKTLLDLTQRKNFYAGDLLMSVEILRNVTDTFKRASYIPASDGVQVREAIPWRNTKWAWGHLWAWGAGTAPLEDSWSGVGHAPFCWGRIQAVCSASSGSDPNSLVLLPFSVLNKHNAPQGESE